MLTLEDYIQLLEAPMTVDKEAVEPLQAMLTYAPYCASTRLLLLRAFFQNGKKKDWVNELQRSLLYAPFDVSVYFLLQPTKNGKSKADNNGQVAEEKRIKKEKTSDKNSMSYFDLLDKMAATAKKTGISFEELKKRYIETSKYTKQ